MSALSSEDFLAIALTLKLALVTTLILMLVAIAIAAWLSNTKSFLKGPFSAVVALPLVLPPTVLGFYLLLLMSPSGVIGNISQYFGIQSLNFTFSGIVLASVCYSLPFAVQPIQLAFEAIDKRQYDIAASMGANRWQRFLTITLPQSKSGLLTAMVMGFSHTLGEFGVVLMVGGNIPGVSRVVSIQIYDHVESLDYSSAHALSLIMLIASFLMLTLIYGFQQKNRVR